MKRTEEKRREGCDLAISEMSGVVGDDRMLQALTELNDITPPAGLRWKLLSIPERAPQRWWSRFAGDLSSWRYAFAGSVAVAVCAVLFMPWGDEGIRASPSVAAVYTDSDLEMIVVGMTELDDVDVNEVI